MTSTINTWLKKIVFLCYSVFCLSKHGIAVHVYGVDNKKRHSLCPVSVRVLYVTTTRMLSYVFTHTVAGLPHDVYTCTMTIYIVIGLIKNVHTNIIV